jgi:hypothetical protein
MTRSAVLTRSRNIDPTIRVFGARVEAELARQAVENARKDARLDAFLGSHNAAFIDAARDERGVYWVR